MAEPAQKNSNSSRDAQCAAGGFCTALSVVFRPLVWLIKGPPFRAGRRLSRAGFSCLCCPSEFSAGPDGRLLRDECRHRVFLLDGGEVGPDSRGHSLTTDENRLSMKKEL